MNNELEWRIVTDPEELQLVIWKHKGEGRIEDQLGNYIGTFNGDFRHRDSLICAVNSEATLRQQLAAAQNDAGTAWAQAHRLALELECLLLDTKDNAIVSKWWDSGMEALSEYQELQPQAAENAEAWAAMRKAGI